MKIEVAPPSRLSPEDLARWSALQTLEPAFDSPFLSPAWALACEALAPRGSAVRAAVIRQDGEAVGFLAARVAGAVAMPAGAPMNDYQALVAEPGLVIDPRRIVDALGVQRIDFSHLVPGQAAFQPYLRGTSLSYVIEQPSGYAAYAEARRAAGSGVTKDIDKRRRKVEREVGPTRFVAQSADQDAFDRLIAWKRAQYRATGQTDIFARGWTAELLQRLRGLNDEGLRGRLFTLHIGEQLAAVQFNLLSRRTVHAWIIAHDEAFEKYSPGLMLFQDILKWMETGPYRALDLGGGDYRFKLQLSTLHRPIGHGVVGRPSPALLLREAQYGVRAAAERLPLGQMSHLPAKAMRRMDLWRGLR